MTNRSLLLAGGLPSFQGVTIASLGFMYPDDTNINTISGTNITGLDVAITGPAILECQLNALTCISNDSPGTARSQNDVRSQQPMGFFFDVTRGGTDSNGLSFGMYVFVDKIASLMPTIDLEGVGIEIARDSPSTIDVGAYVYAPGAGSATRTSIYSGLPLALNGFLRIVVVIQRNTMISWKEDAGGGGIKTMFTTAPVIGNWNDGNHGRVAFNMNSGTTEAGRFFIASASTEMTWQR